MQINSRIYVGILTVAGASLLALFLLPRASALQAVAAVPLVGSLVVGLFQLVRDIISYERNQLLQGAEHRFLLGASSHMANVAFDKHAGFAEEYVAEVFSTLDTLFREGPTREALPHASKLFELRRKYAVWLTPEIESILQKFEQALRKVGANDWYLQHSSGGQDRSKAIDEMYKVFANILGKENMGETWQGVPLSEEVAVSRVLAGLRALLGIDELTRIRAGLISKALDGLDGNNS